MPVVFIHGVSVRKDHEYYKPSEQTRDALFKQISLKGVAQQASGVNILNPYWGDSAATFAWDRESLPGSAEVESFGSAESVLAKLAEEAVTELSPATEPLESHRLLTALARKSLPRAIDLLWTAAGLTSGSDAVANSLAVNGLKAQRYATAHKQPDWLPNVQSDAQFVNELLSKVSAWEDPDVVPSTAEVESFGIDDIWNYITEAAKKLGKSAAASVTNPVVAYIRPALNEKVTLFVGDVFFYLRSREKHGSACPIVKTVGAALVSAQQERSEQDPFIVVGHSMGGVIAYDLLSSSLAGQISCDLLLTVGSQVALFEEMKLFKSSQPSIKHPQKVDKPNNVKRWINVFDRADVVSYQAAPIFNQIEDYEYETGETVLHAHGAYLLQPQFHQHLNARILGNAG